MTKLLDKQWRSFAERVMPAGAPLIQHQECRRAFYAGAQAFFGIVMTEAEAGDEPTDADMDMIQSLDDELQQFARDVERGRA